MKLLGMKAPSHLRSTKLRYNEKGNLTGLTSSQTAAEAMIACIGADLTQTALRLDPHIQDVTANQQWISMKAHGVELGWYFLEGGLNQIKEEVTAGPSALELPFTPRWVTSPERMTDAARNGLIRHSTIRFIVRSLAQADRVMKQGLKFRGRYHKVEKFISDGPDTMCSTCCHWGHSTYICPTPSKARCAIYAEPHLTEYSKCPISTCKIGVGKYCSKNSS